MRHLFERFEYWAAQPAVVDYGDVLVIALLLAVLLAVLIVGCCICIPRLIARTDDLEQSVIEIQNYLRKRNL